MSEKDLKISGNILYSGVGGQGIILASEITAFVLQDAGYDVKKSEVHGMAQRGGSVVAHMRYAKKVYSPVIEPGGADIMVAFEMLEALRYLPFVNKSTRTIVNTQRILPPAVATGKQAYPDNTESIFRQRGLAIYPVDAFKLAAEAGEIKTVNMVLVGALSVLMPFDEKLYSAVIDRRVPERFREVNHKAFALGRQSVQAGA